MVWKERWETSRKSDRKLKRQPVFPSEKCAGYLYLLKILTHIPEYEIFREALFCIDALKIDGKNWQKRLQAIGRNGNGSIDDNFALGLMGYFIEVCNIKSQARAAECAVATMGLYSDAASWHSAVTRCRNVWRLYKAGKFAHSGSQSKPHGIFVRPRTAKLTNRDVRKVLDPFDLKYLPSRGKRVDDTPYWRKMIEFGAVKLVTEKLQRD